MKSIPRIVLAAIILLAAMYSLGCSGVQLNQQYSDLLDKTAALSDALATKAERGQLTPAEQAAILRYQATTWKKFQNARDGVATTQP
jgi:hypothetical protein